MTVPALFFSCRDPDRHVKVKQSGSVLNMLRRLDKIRFRGHKRDDFLDLAESPNASDTECGDEVPLKIPRTSPRDSEELRDPVSTPPGLLGPGGPPPPLGLGLRHQGPHLTPGSVDTGWAGLCGSCWPLACHQLPSGLPGRAAVRVPEPTQTLARAAQWVGALPWAADVQRAPPRGTVAPGGGRRQCFVSGAG